jgi:hypothetical protein
MIFQLKFLIIRAQCSFKQNFADIHMCKILRVGNTGKTIFNISGVLYVALVKIILYNATET